MSNEDTTFQVEVVPPPKSKMSKLSALTLDSRSEFGQRKRFSLKMIYL